ncbi:unnamed protein product, partial [Choristocarpus tenellus]
MGRNIVARVASWWSPKSFATIIVLIVIIEMVVVHFLAVDTPYIQKFKLGQQQQHPSLPPEGDEKTGTVRSPLLRGKRSHARLNSVGVVEEDYEEMRLAVVIPYIGSSLPAWFDTFAELAMASSDLVDWIVFCTEELADISTPPNVRMVPMSLKNMAWKLAGIVYPADADERPQEFPADFFNSSVEDTFGITPKVDRSLSGLFIEKLLKKNGYFLIDFKPTLGWVFREYLEGYSHWAYGDLDVLFGDLSLGWLEVQELRKYDIITFSFGDQHRAYLRGQLTVHKNTPRINRLWRDCSHLGKFTNRVQMYSMTKKYMLQSAEGCYSKILRDNPDITVKFAIKVFSDRGSDHSKRDVVITGDGMVKSCPTLEGRLGE